MSQPQHLRDLLYLDSEKAASIFSQIYGGLIRETQEATEQGTERRRGFAFDLKLIRPEFGGTSSERSEVIESRVLHHALLLQIEDALFDLEAAVDLDASVPAPGTADEARALLDDASYVRAEGWSVIEDYDRISMIAGEFPALQEFIQRAAMSGVEDSDEMKALRESIEEKKQAAIGKPPKIRQKELREASALETELDKALKQAVEADEAPAPWLIEGIQRWVKVFLPGRITLRTFPFADLPDFQIIGNLKRESFVDADLGNLIFAYGTQPNVKLTVIGLLTSLPRADGPPFDPLGEFELTPDGEGTEEFEFERGFRGLFEGMEGLEKFSRFARYPNVTIYPLAVYRRVAVRPVDESSASLDGQ
jgi:hypothetical protein